MPDEELRHELKEMGVRLQRLEDLCQQTTDVLRGTGDRMGLVGRVEVLWRSWAIGIGLLGMAAGWVLNEVVK